MYFKKSDFLSLTADKILKLLANEIDYCSNNEVTSWINTIDILKNNLKLINYEFVVILELKLPFSLHRIDVSIVYLSQNAIVFDIIELKQWDNKNIIGIPPTDKYSIYFNSIDDIRLNPVIQLNSYAYTLLSSYKEFHDSQFNINQVLIMPNYDFSINKYIFSNDNVEYYDKHNYKQYFLNLNKRIEHSDEEFLLKTCQSLTYLTLPSNIFEWIETEKIKLKNDEIIVYKKTLEAINLGKDILISGPAGSGKTVLGINIAKRLLESNYNVIYASANEIKMTFTKQANQYAKYNSIFRVFGNAISNIQNNVIIIIDEAHRMQIDQINKIFAQKLNKKFTVIWLIDENQSYRPFEDVVKADIVQHYSNGNFQDLFLNNTQFRCNGNTNYINDCRSMLSNANIIINENVEILDSLTDGMNWYNSLSDNNKGIVASDCWAGGIINIEGLRLTTIKEFGVWMNDIPSNNPVSVYKAQGMQKNHILFIWGNEFVYRKGFGWTVQKNEVKDKAWMDYFNSGCIDESYIQKKFANLYYVLLTRFQVNMKIFCTDIETREYLKKCFNNKRGE